MDGTVVSRVLELTWRSVGRLGLLFVAVLCSLVIGLQIAEAATDPDLGIDINADMVDEFWSSSGSATRQVAAEFLPDGRMLMLNTSGNVRIVNVSGGPSVDHFTIPNVDSSGERGSLDLVAHPDFANNNTFFVYYTAPLPNNEARLTISSFVLGASGALTQASEQVVWQNPGPNHINAAHVGGSLNIGPDLTLYLSVGDGLVSSNSQDLSNVFGTMLRINLDGSVPADNPFVGQAGALDEIYAYGLRNPFRATFDDVTGDLLVGDVGGNNAAVAIEEVNVIEPGANYGWPTCEGVTGCAANITLPIHWYDHDVNGGCCQNRSITGGEMYRGAAIPFAGNVYVYGDFADQKLKWAQFDSNNNELATGLLDPPGQPASFRPVWVEVSPVDGWIYYFKFSYAGSGEIRRLRYTGAPVDQPPTISEASATPITGAAPLAVTFTGAATDPDGPVAFSWDFGDGTSSTEASPAHTYLAAGAYDAVLTVTSGADSVSAAPMQISVGTPPIATILTPNDQTTFAAGDVIVITGEGTDEAGQALAPADLSWEVRFQHEQHEHPGVSGTGTSITLTVPASGHGFAGNTGYLVELTATDSLGLTTVETIELVPRKVAIAIEATLPVPPSILVDGITLSTAAVVDTIEGHLHLIETEALHCVADERWDFVSWSSGATRAHNLTAAAVDQTLTATYVNVGPDPACPIVGQLRVSEFADRSESHGLDGVNVGAAGSRYFFFEPTGSVDRVRFWLDDPTASGVPDRTETVAPFDYAGGGTSNANALSLAAIGAGPHTMTVVVTHPDGTTDLVTASFVVGAAVEARLTVLSQPCVIYDSRSATGTGLGGSFNGGETRTINTRGSDVTEQGGLAGCLPTDANDGLMVTVTAADPVAAGNLRLSSVGVVPDGGVVNYAANGLNNSNTVTVIPGAGAGGAIDIAANGGSFGAGSPSTDVRLVAIGYYVPATQILESGELLVDHHSLTPCAAADSRSSQGASGSWLGPHVPGSTLTVDVVGTLTAGQGGESDCGVPASATAVVVNLVAVSPGGTGSLAAGPVGSSPTEATVHFAGLGMNNAASTVVPLSASGSFDIALDGEVGSSAGVRVVVLGYVEPGTGLSYHALTPCAAFDTRPAQGGAGGFAGWRDGGLATTYAVAGSSLPAGQGGGHGGSCGVPIGAEAVLINLVAIDPTVAGNLQAFATGSTPTGGVLNFAALSPSMNNANAVVVPISALGELDVYVNTGPSDVPDATQLRGVILGYFD